MLLAFLGAPNSGKTTTAAMVFAALKDAGQLAELVPEQARVYIARHRLSQFEAYNQKQMLEHPDRFGGVPPWNFPITLDDKDQCVIMLQQSDLESIMCLASGPQTTVVSDTSTVCTLFYMSESCRNDCLELARKAVRETDIFFYVKPVSNQTSDPNRIHDQTFSTGMDETMLPLLGKWLPEILPKIVPLFGSAEERKIQALTAYYNKKYAVEV